MHKIAIVSNNPLIACAAAYFVPVTGIVPVLERARDLVHGGHHLLTHPLAGSVKPNENPYRSLVVTHEALGVDYQSILLLEGAITVARRMLSERPYRAFPAAVLLDLQLIDQALLRSAVDSLTATAGGSSIGISI